MLSRQLAKLEDELGARLIQRSTRRFSVTEIGQEYYERCVAVLVEAAVRNTILQLRGIDTYQEFVERHRRAMERDTGG